MTVTFFDPEHWLQTTVRGIKWYVERAFQNATKNSSGDPAGLDGWEIMTEFPGPILDSIQMPLYKSIVHFEIDDIVSRLVGFGDGIFALNYDEQTKTVDPQDAMIHEINFDVGVWTSDISGGTTARMRAREILTSVFGPLGIKSLAELTDNGDGGIQVVRFTGGRNTIDTINDVRVYRTIGAELDVRVFSRTPRLDASGPTIEQISQSPGLTILG